MLLVSTSCFKGYGLHKIFKLVSETEYDGLNLDLVPGDFDSEDADYILSLIEEFKVKVVTVSAYERKMDSTSVNSVIELARKIGAKLVNFYPPHRADKDTSWFSDHLHKVQQRNKDVEISIVNVEPKTFLFFIPEYKDATLSMIRKFTGNTTLSITNVDASTGVDLLKTFSILGNTIKNIYLADKTGGRSEVLLGKGEMPLRDLLGRLKDNGYRGMFTVKISSKELGAGKDEMILLRLKETKNYFDKYFTI